MNKKYYVIYEVNRKTRVREFAILVQAWKFQQEKTGILVKEIDARVTEYEDE